MKTLLYSSLMFLTLLASNNVSFAQNNLLFLGAENTGLDSAMIESLGYEDYKVTFVSSTDFKATDSPYESADAYADYDALIISESIGSKDANNFQVAGYPIPVVSCEGFTLKSGRWGFFTSETEADLFIQASSSSLDENVLQMVITNTEHWITEEFSTDDEFAWAESETPTNLGVTSFIIPDTVVEATPLAEFKFDMGDDFAAVWAIDSGAMLRGTIELPNMVFIGIIQTTAQGHSITTYFNDFLVRCIQWVTGDYEIISGINTVNSDDILVSPNPVNDFVNISLTMASACDIKVNIYDITGKLVISKDAEYLSAGKNNIQLNVSNLSSAQYIYEVVTNTEVIKGKLIKE